MDMEARKVHQWQLRAIAVALGALQLTATPQIQRNHPQYVIVNKASFSADDLAWNQDDPSTCNQASIDQIFAKLANVTVDGNSTRRLGVGHQLVLLDPNGNATVQFLGNMFNLSLANDLPIAFALDPFQFWDSRPDLWNWWNSSAAGYDAANVNNVEWSSWPAAATPGRGSPTAAAEASTDAANTATNATAIAWRDWGSQFRVPPHPNLASSAVIGAYVEALRPIARMVGEWYRDVLVPQGKQYLLAYAKVGWEVNIGANYYYYPNGNEYLFNGTAPSNDPKTGISAAIQVGYNAVCSLGLACSGNITTAQLDTVVQNLLSTLAAVMQQEGIPRSKLMTHVGPSYHDMPTNNSIWNTPAAAVIDGSPPGYSFYSYAYNPSIAPGLDPALDAIDSTHWGASEWLYLGGNSGSVESQWMQAFQNTLGYRNSRFVDVFNWEGIEGSNDTMAALQAVLSTPYSPACLVEPASTLTATQMSNGSILLTWTPAIDDDGGSFLDVSSCSSTLPSGALSAPIPAIASHANVSGLASTILAPPSPSYQGANMWASIVSIGCSGTQKMVSDVLQFTFPSGSMT